MFNKLNWETAKRLLSNELKQITNNITTINNTIAGGIGGGGYAGVNMIEESTYTITKDDNGKMLFHNVNCTIILPPITEVGNIQVTLMLNESGLSINSSNMIMGETCANAAYYENGVGYITAMSIPDSIVSAGFFDYLVFSSGFLDEVNNENNIWFLTGVGGMGEEG